MSPTSGAPAVPRAGGVVHRRGDRSLHRDAIAALRWAHRDSGRPSRNIQPFLILLVLPRVLPAERLTVRRVLGTGLAFTGVVFVLAERGTSGGSLLGDALVLLAAATWTVVIILSKSTPDEVNAVSLIFWNVAGAAPVLALLTVIA